MFRTPSIKMPKAFEPRSVGRELYDYKSVIQLLAGTSAHCPLLVQPLAKIINIVLMQIKNIYFMISKN